MKEILHYNITYSMHWDSLVNVPLYINCLKEKFSVRWNIFSEFLLQSLLVKTKCSCYILGNLWTLRNKSFTRAALIHFYLKTCSIFCWPRLSFLLLNISHHSQQHRCRTPRGGGKPSLSDARVGLRAERSEIFLSIILVVIWFNLIMLMLSGFTIWPD